MGIKEITCFQSSDGKLHDNMQQAKKAEAILDLRALINDKGYSSMHQDAVTDLLLENAERICEFLGDIAIYSN